MFIFPHGTWKDNIRSVILDWRRRSAGHSSKGERSAGRSSEGRDLVVTQADLSAPRVCSPVVALLHKKGPRHRRKICANSLLVYSYYTQSSRLIGLVGRVFVNGPGDLGSIPGRVIPKTLNWYLIPPCLTISNIRYVSRVKWINLGNGVTSSPTPRCSSYWKGSLLVTLD